MSSQQTETKDKKMEAAVFHDARAVYDAAALRFSDYESNDSPSWIFAEFFPASDSGSATIPGAYVDADTGEMVMPETVEAVIVKKGRWQLLASSHPDQHNSGNYSWTESMAESRHMLEPEDLYSPFVHGGLLLFQPNLAGKGIGQFKHPLLIFSQWKEMVKSAFIYSSQTDDRKDGRFTSEDADILRGLIKQSNSLLSGLALRESLRLRAMTPESAAELLLEANYRLKAVFIFLMLTSSSMNDRSGWSSQIMASATEAENLDDLHGIGLGAFAATLFRYQDAVIVAGGKAVLATVKKRLETLKIPHEEAPQLYFMLDRVGGD